MKRAVVVVVGLAVSAAAPVASADVPTRPKHGSDEDEATTLLQDIEREATTLALDDCTAACKALGSMRRAADRLCALDPGERCATARARVDEAAARVREACKACAVASAPAREEPVVTADRGTPMATAESSTRKGGCASCVTASGDRRAPLDAAALAAATALAVGLVRRRRARR